MLKNKELLVEQTIISVSDYLNIPPCKITYLLMEEKYRGIAGVFFKNDYVINVNLQVLNNLNDFEIMTFFIHEIRHAYQWRIINENKQDLEPKLISYWKYEFYNYVLPTENEIKYLNQLIEIDAIAFTVYFCKRFLKQNLIIPKQIYCKVCERIKEIEKK